MKIFLYMHNILFLFLYYFECYFCPSDAIAIVVFKFKLKNFSIDSGFDCKAHKFLFVLSLIHGFLVKQVFLIYCLFHSRIHSSFICLNIIYLM